MDPDMISPFLLTMLGIAAPAQQGERPLPPTVAAPAPLETTFCDSARQGSYEARLETQLAALDAANKAAETYNKALSDWKIGRLVAAGAWTPKDRTGWHRRLLADPVLAESERQKRAKFQEMMTEAGLASAADRRKDWPGACRQYLRMLDVMVAMQRSNAESWGYTQARYDAEAKTRGVALPEG